MTGREMLLTLQQKFYCYLFHNPQLRDDFYVTSYLIPQATLGIIRGVLFVYCLIVLISNLVVNIIHGAGWNWAAYFTTLSFFGITLYYGVATYTTLRYWQKQQQYGIRFNKQSLQNGDENSSVVIDSALLSQEPVQLTPAANNQDSIMETTLDDESTQLTTDRREIVEIEVASDIIQDKEEEDVEMKPRNTTESFTILHQLTLAMQQILYESFACFAPLVTIVYWGLLYSTESVVLDTMLDLWMGISMHAINTILMLLEVFVFAKSPFNKGHFSILFGFLLLYLGLAYFMVGVYDFYVYPFF
ncbi:hypothetical protein COEREDRAFT_82795, partial [Coemansia reversa NRRL 1564]